jgi:hypothetical protein
MSKYEKPNGRDPEVEKLLEACREVRPTVMEMDSWKSAIRAELRKSDSSTQSSVTAPAAAPRPRSNLVRLVFRTVAQIGVAASLGFVVGAYVVEQRFNEGQAMLFSQTEGETTALATIEPDESREIVRVSIE